MPLLVSEAIVLHAFDYLESSRIVRLVTRDAGLRSALARGARKSRRRFGSGLDLFAQGTAHIHTKPGRDLDILSGFEDVHLRTHIGTDLGRFTGAAAIAEIALFFGRDGADAELFDAVATAFDALATPSDRDAREITLAGAWRIVAALGFAPTLRECAECGTSLGDVPSALFSHAAGGTLCAKCASLTAGGRKLPASASRAIESWIADSSGHPEVSEGSARIETLSDAEARSHQRLLRQFLAYHLHDGRALRAFDLWERSDNPEPAPVGASSA
jgi:DNA repair protein RecO (recombination protein O)